MEMSPYYKHNVFQFGVRRVEQSLVNGTWTPATTGASNRPDLYGILDTTVVKAAGQMWGLRTLGNSFAQFQASPMSSGPPSSVGGYCSDYWTQTTQLTIECCISPPAGQQRVPSRHTTVGDGNRLLAAVTDHHHDLEPAEHDMGHLQDR